MVNKKADLGTKVLIGLLIVFVFGIVFMSKPTITGFAVVELDDTRLSIYDETNTTVKYAGNDVIFYANYSNLTDNSSISGACNITFEDSADNVMTYASDLYTYSRNFTDNGTFLYYINCTNEAGYANLSAEDNATIAEEPSCDSCENCTILAQSSGVITLQNDISTDVGDCILVNSSDLEIDCAGYNISAGTGSDDCGIDAWQSSFINITVHDCNFVAGYYGYGSRVNDSVDYDNFATSDVTYGRYSWLDNNVTIRDSNYSYNGIDLEGTTNSWVYNNILENIVGHMGDEGCTSTEYGVYLLSMSITNQNNLIENNIISLGDCGRYIGSENSYDNVFSNNYLTGTELNILPYIYFTGASNLTLLNQNLSKEYSPSNILWENFNGTLTSRTNGNVSVGSRYASINSESAPEVNTTAAVTLSFTEYFNGIYYYDIYSTDADTIVANGQICNEGTTPACTNIVIGPDSVTFDAEHFSSYAVNTSSCAVPADNYYVNENLTLCNGGDYTADDIDGDGLFILNASNVIIDCNGSTLNGDSTDDIAFNFSSNSISSVTIKNCNFDNYYNAIKVSGASSNLIYSNNFTNSVLESINILLGSYNQIYSNRFENDTLGVNIAGTSSCIIDPDPGTCYARYNNNKIFSNTFVNQTTGVKISTTIGGSCSSPLIRCSNPTTNNSVYSNIFNESDTAVYLGTTTANINNLKIYDSISYDFYATGSSANSIINSTFDRAKVDAVSSAALSFLWPVKISTSSSATIVVKDASNATEATLTAISGYAYANLTEYYIEDSVGENYTPHNLTSSRSGYYSRSVVETINQSKNIDLTLTLIPSTGGNTGSDGSGGLAQFVPQTTTFNADFNEKDNFDIKMTKLDKLNIKTKKGVTHTLRILRTDTAKKSCIIEIASTPKNYTLALDETIQVDYENDGVKDLEITLKTFGTYWTFLLKELNVAQPKEQVVEIPAESKEPVEIAPTQPATEQPAAETTKDYTWAWTLLFFGLIAAVLVSIIATRKHTKNIDTQVAETRKIEQQMPMPETKPIKAAELPKPAKQAERMDVPESDLSKIRALDDINKRIDEINKNLRRF